MELLKSENDIVIDPNYIPSLDMNYLDYFMRAMAFAQTNYQDQLHRVATANFRKLNSTRFFEEYAWIISTQGEDLKEASLTFCNLSKALTKYYIGFWDLNNFPKEEEMKELVVSVNDNEKKFHALHNCAQIINQGTKLFGWDRYKDNFLNTPEKLSVLPMLGITGAKQLSRNIGVSFEILSTAKLHPVAVHYGFMDFKSLCQAIQQRVALQPRIIELILWYAVVTFGANISQITI